MMPSGINLSFITLNLKLKYDAVRILMSVPFIFVSSSIEYNHLHFLTHRNRILSYVNLFISGGWELFNLI